MIKSKNTLDFPSLLPPLLEALSAVPVDSEWVSSALFEETLRRDIKALPQDLKALEGQARFIFRPEGDAVLSNEQAVDLLRCWILQERAPSLLSLCVFAIENLSLDLDPDLLNAVCAAAFLADVKHEHPYHSNMHFRKVLLQTLRMIVVHNDIFQGTERILSHKQIALLMISACIHDLGHDGKGNVIKGVFMQARLEQRSFDLARPYFKAVGFEDKEAFEAISVMILCTEVTPLNDPANPVSQMKAAYRFHYRGEGHSLHSLNLDQALDALQENSSLSLMAVILHEADIATSAGLSYEVTQYETALHREEVAGDRAKPKHIIEFLDVICKRQMLSDAGKRLYAANMARIYAFAERGVQEGNQPFPQSIHSAFLNRHQQSETEGHPRTLN